MLMKMKMICFYCLFGFLVLCEASFDCSQTSHDACRNLTVPKDFPGNEEELEVSCRKFLERLQCTIDFEEACQKGEISLDNGNTLFGYMTRICSKDHPMYSVLVNHLECAKPIMDDKDGTCFDSYPNEETFEGYAKTLIDSGIEAFPGDQRNHVECLMALYTTVCRGKEMEKCGQTAVDAYISFYRELHAMIVDECGDKIGTYFTEISRVLNGEKE